MRALGWKGPDLKDPRDYKYKAVRYKGAIPNEVDIALPPVQNQYNVGCCVYKAITLIMEWAQVLGVGDNQIPYYLSALYGYWQYRAKYGNVNIDDGAYIRLACDLAANVGICIESLWPYMQGKHWDYPPPILTPEDSRVHKIENYWSLDSDSKQKTLSNIIDCLAEQRPLLGGFTLFDSFMSDEVAKTGLVPYPNLKTELPAGGHCMVIKGYRLSDEKFLLRNSWGEWGMHGDCWVPFDFLLDLGSDFWTINCVSG